MVICFDISFFGRRFGVFIGSGKASQTAKFSW